MLDSNLPDSNLLDSNLLDSNLLDSNLLDMIERRRNARSQVTLAGARQRRGRVKLSSARARRSSVHREASRRPVGRGRGRRVGRAGGGFFEFLNRHRSAIRSHLTRGRREPHVTDISVEAGRRWRRMPEHQKDLYYAAASRRR